VAARADHWAIAKVRWQLPVLKTRPWQDLTWPELAEAIARLSVTPDPTTRGWLSALEGWSAELRSLLPALSAAAHRVADELTADELRRHRAAPLLFQARSRRLDQANLARQCRTPRRVVALADALGVSAPELPD
jgi:serine/threonine protein phosphatase 1